MNISGKDLDVTEDLRVAFRPAASGANVVARRSQSFGRKRGKTPQQFNGIHRRRNKKIRW